jgi:hypothetical protein
MRADANGGADSARANFAANLAIRRYQQRRIPQQSGACRRLHQII